MMEISHLVELEVKIHPVPIIHLRFFDQYLILRHFSMDHLLPKMLQQIGIEFPSFCIDCTEHIY